MPLITQAIAEAKFTALSAEYDTLVSRPVDTTDPEGARITERRLSELQQQMDYWSSKYDELATSGSTVGAIKLMRRRPA